MKLGLLLPVIVPLHAVALPTLSSALGPRDSNSLNGLLALISQLFPAEILVQDAGNLIIGAETAFADLAGFATSEGDLNDGICGDVTIIWARGTNEPGDVGSLVGPPFFDAVRERLENGKTLAVQGVDGYAASVTGFLEGGDGKGSQSMADLVTKALKQCPSSKIVMSGYSQGGQVVHNAAKLLPASAVAAVNSIVIFGDPDNGSPLQSAAASKVLTICHTGDNICDHGDLILLPHLTYLLDADTAADFVIKNAF
ncbi:carbohydrate esterase family 5 protein [Xylariales sp. AK1849]|nr:carbohydrate esterase family 5 protein [Xylariales sp. AK1849]